MKKILVTGGNGRFSAELKKIKKKFKFIFLGKTQLDILDPKSINKALKKYKPDSLLHLAGLSRPMSEHEKNISKSIKLNIIGTSNLVIECANLNIKLIYFSTNHVYPGIKGNYKEKDPVLPINKYAVSKFGGECSVQMYSNSLILRICMTEKPFIHKKAFNDVETNFMFHESLAKNLLKLIDKKGIINVGGEKNTVLNFAKKNNQNIETISAKKTFGRNYPLKQSMNINLYKKAIK